jgi:phospholipid/cholesterol/gamma-HCH transport system ATP-binding protein
MSGDAAAEPLIRVEDLEARYGDTTILHGITCEVRRGEVFVIVGGSGSGKTTLLRHMIGLLRPVAGRVLIEGDDITQADEEQLQRIQRKLGVTFQAGALFGSLTLGQNVALPLEEYTTLPRETIELLVRIKLAIVKLDRFAEYMISELSGGRSAPGACRLPRPGDLTLDEPAGLDPITSAELEPSQVSRAPRTVVSHELPSIFTIADRCIMIDAETKNIIAEGPPLELRDQSIDPARAAFFNRQPAPPPGKGKDKTT